MKYFSRNIIILFLFSVIVPIAVSCTGTQEHSNGWEQAYSILNKIIPPTFPDKNFDITFYGAKGDGVTDCTEAFKNAIEDCVNNGGGKVVVPQGVFLTGPIHLKSNVNLNITDNAVVKFSDDKSKYLPVVFSRWEGVECMNYSALIYAYGQENIAITGKGLLDGQGSNDNWWSWKGNDKYGWKEGMPNQKIGRDKLFKMGEDIIPPEKRIMGEGYYLRPNFVQFYKSKNILISDVTFKNSPMWFINPVLCQNVSVIGVTVQGLGPNNDGCDPESSKDVLIRGCFFNTGDDCIAIKSGRNNDGRRINVTSENIVIQNCVMKEGHGGVVIGSEISGGSRNVFAENCTMSSPNLERAIRIKTNSVRGGKIENIFVRNIEIGEVKQAVLTINFFYEEGDSGNFTPSVNNIELENVTSKKSSYALWVKAYERSPVTGLKIINCEFSNVKENSIIENFKSPIIKSVKINEKSFLINN
jgi:polygalacturonase